MAERWVAGVHFDGGYVIAVTGASGWIGAAVCTALEAKNERCVKLSRTGQGGGGNFDLGDPQWATAWPRALENCSTVIHCAAHVHRPKETAAERTLFSEINVVGTKRLLEACRMARVGRFVFVSTMAVYKRGDGDFAWREEEQVGPTTAYGASKLAAEKLVRESEVDWRIGRLATVYGVGDRANFARLAAALRKGKFVLPGKGSARKSVLPASRAASLLSQLALAGPSRVVVNLASPSAPSLEEICAAFVKVCGFRRPLRAPVSLLRGMAVCGNLLEAAIGSAPLTSSTLNKLTTSTVVDVERMRTLFPDEPWRSFEEELRDACSYYQAAV